MRHLSLRELPEKERRHLRCLSLIEQQLAPESQITIPKNLLSRQTILTAQKAD
jgi:hypothetical protein